MLLHFGAVDSEAVVYLDGQLVEARGRLHAVHPGHHLAGVRRGQHELVVRADDDPHDLAKPRGKQDWQLEPHSDLVPAHHRHLADRLAGGGAGDPHRDAALDAEPASAGRSAFEATVAGRSAEERPPPRACRFARGDQLLADDTYAVMAGEVTGASRCPIRASTTRATSCSGPRDSPDAHPGRADAADGARRAAGRRCRATRRCARSACREIASCSTAGRTRCGWCSTRATGRRRGLTAPDDAALRRDVELAKAHGLQRRPQAPEDRGPALPLLGRPARPAGLGARCRAPTASRRRSVERVTREWTEAIDRDCSHPCIVAWVPINESLGRARPARQPGRSATTSRRSTT